MEALVSLMVPFRLSVFLGGFFLSHLPLANTSWSPCGVQVRSDCGPIQPRNTVVTESAFGTFDTMGMCQVLVEIEIRFHKS